MAEKIRLTGKVTYTFGKGSNPHTAEYSYAEIELDSPDLSSLKEGDEVLVNLPYFEGKMFTMRKEDIVAILPKIEKPKPMPEVPDGVGIVASTKKGGFELVTGKTVGALRELIDCVKDLQDRMKRLEKSKY